MRKKLNNYGGAEEIDQEQESEIKTEEEINDLISQLNYQN